MAIGVIREINFGSLDTLDLLDPSTYTINSLKNGWKNQAATDLANSDNAKILNFTTLTLVFCKKNPNAFDGVSYRIDVVEKYNVMLLDIGAGNSAWSYPWGPR